MRWLADRTSLTQSYYFVRKSSCLRSALGALKPYHHRGTTIVTLALDRNPSELNEIFTEWQIRP